MSDRVRKQVLGYLVGALDDSEMEAVKALLESDPAYRQAMRRARSGIAPLSVLRHAATPPWGLAERTCRFIFDPARRLRNALSRRAMTPSPVAFHTGGRLRWADAGVAVAILLASALLILPAVNGTRFQARVIVCQDNLRQIGQAMTEYSQKNNDVFPRVPTEGKLAAAGIYAPILAQDGYLTRPGTVLCPDSAQAREQSFRVPSLNELQSAVGQRLSRIQQTMGGSYGYCLGYFDHGVYHPTQNLYRDYFAIMADSPSLDRPNRQSDNHGGIGQNVLFEDSHVGFFCTTRLGGGNDDIFANDNDEVAPGLNRDDSVIASSGTAPVILVSFP